MECFASFYEKIRQQHTQEKFAQRQTIALLRCIPYDSHHISPQTFDIRITAFYSLPSMEH